MPLQEESENHEVNTNTKLCAECKQSIHLDAIKCHHCRSYQWWLWRHGLKAATVISPFVSIFLGIVALYIALPDESDLKAHFVNYTIDTNRYIFHIRVTNEGNKIGSILPESIVKLESPDTTTQHIKFT